MRDFARKYHRGVAHFGLWAEETADQKGDRDAWAILCDAARRCTTEDMREAAEVAEALEWFESRMVRQAAPRNFRNALDLSDPTQRYFALRDALILLAKHAGLPLAHD